MTVGPALLLSLLLGLINTSLYVLIRGDGGTRLPLMYLAAALGAWAGAAVGGRLGLTFVAIGDYPLVPAMVVSWLGVAIVAILATLGRQSGEPGG